MIDKGGEQTKVVIDRVMIDKIGERRSGKDNGGGKTKVVKEEAGAFALV